MNFLFAEKSITSEINSARGFRDFRKLVSNINALTPDSQGISAPPALNANLIIQSLRNCRDQPMNIEYLEKDFAKRVIASALPAQEKLAILNAIDADPMGDLYMLRTGCFCIIAILVWLLSFISSLPTSDNRQRLISRRSSAPIDDLDFIPLRYLCYFFVLMMVSVVMCERYTFMKSKDPQALLAWVKGINQAIQDTSAGGEKNVVAKIVPNRLGI